MGGGRGNQLDGDLPSIERLAAGGPTLQGEIMADHPLKVDPKAIPWAHTVLFQSLIVQLIDAKVFSVENAERVFDIALQRQFAMGRLLQMGRCGAGQ